MLGRIASLLTVCSKAFSDSPPNSQDIGPKNILERLVCCGIILSAGLCWAYILGEARGTEPYTLHRSAKPYN